MNVKNSWRLIALSAMMLTFASCGKDDSDDPAPDKLFGGEGNVLVETTVKNSDGASGQSYMQQIPQISSSVNMSQGIQIGFSATITTVGNDVFVFPEFGTTGKQRIVKYEHTPKGLKLAGEMQIIPNSYPVNLTKISDDKAYVPMYNLGKVLVINPTTLETTGEIDLTEYAFNDSSADPAHGLLLDGYYYLPFNQIGANWMPYDEHRQVDVAVIDASSDKVVKVISEKASGLCFPTRPFLKDMIFVNEQGDIYVACAGYFGYNPEYVKSGFACISASKKEFDEGKTWDISGTEIEGCEYKASTIYNCKYIGNGKVAAYVGVLELMGDNPYTARNSMAVMIDLNKKTIKKIEGVPYTDGHSVVIEYHDGEVLFSSFGVDKAGIFGYDPSTGAVRHLMSSSVNIAYLHFFE
ncbi:MAG: hypothetical protein J6W59_05405 [Bacteroidales bacterium]|nr:hypothetical protein [Bacteroidales bacterium]